MFYNVARIRKLLARAGILGVAFSAMTLKHFQVDSMLESLLPAVAKMHVLAVF